MKIHILPLIVTFVSICHDPLIVMAQVTYMQGGVTQGMFGERSIGQPVSGRATQGMFSYRTVGQPMYGGVTQGMFGVRSIGQPVRYYPYSFNVGNQPAPSEYSVYASQPEVLQTSRTSELPETEYTPPEYSPAQEFAPMPFPETNGMEYVSPLEQGLGMNLGIGLPAPPMSALPRRGIRTETASSVGARQYVHSPELSNRLTLIARAKGMLAGKNIDVYLGDKIALLKGSVRSPGDRVVLANVLGLEPQVRQIDNQLVVNASGAISMERKNP